MLLQPTINRRRMAKKSGKDQSGKAYRGKKPPRVDMTPGQIRDIADELGRMALRIHAVAADMEKSGVSTIKPGLGNFNTAKTKMEAAIEKQLEQRVKDAVRELGKAARTNQ